MGCPIVLIYPPHLQTKVHPYCIRTQGVDLDVAIYMGLDTEDMEAAGGVGALLQAQWRIFNALEDPTRQTAVINMDGTPPPLPTRTHPSSQTPVQWAVLIFSARNLVPIDYCILGLSWSEVAMANPKLALHH